MILKITKYGNPVLRKKAKKVEEINEEILELLNNMVETMYDAPGVGLAGPQVGELKRLAVIDTEGVLKKVINPEILEMSEEKDIAEEGCLSIPGIYGKVERPDKVKVKYLNEKGEEVIEELEGMPARAFQHEINHLDGILFVDKVTQLKKRLISKKLMKLKKETLKNIKKGL
ncbi:MAG: peptide deformylase [Fusobacteriia bacterium 4572_132]|nr:MAG: peptide deformylase [Fusobacteriia bacterium 4572_132]